MRFISLLCVLVAIPWGVCHCTAWYRDEEMLEIVDEIFVDLPIFDLQTTFLGWGEGPIKHQAIQLMEDMRSRGYFIHPWIGELEVHEVE